MKKILAAALFAFAVVVAAPARAGDCEHCKNCPSKMASGDKKDAKPACACAGEGKACACKEGCKCGHCAAGHKHEEKKS